MNVVWNIFKKWAEELGESFEKGRAKSLQQDPKPADNPTSAKSDPSYEYPTLNTTELNNYFTKLDDDYFIKAQKMTNLELTHGFIQSVKEKDREIEEARTSRKVSRI